MTTFFSKTLLNPRVNPSVLDELAQKSDELICAIDLGSNSFHLAIARVDHGEVRRVLSLSDKVQLAAGLDDDNMLSDEVIARGVQCLTAFGEYLDAIPKHHVRVVATNALRKAANANTFIAQANTVLPAPIQVISGREEARLIYLGVSHTNASSDKRLVIDIGGGSTEFIIGQGFLPIEAESLQMGCVAFTKKFFDTGKITESAFKKAIAATQSELFTIIKLYKKVGWRHVVGSSGTIKACHLAIKELGFDDKITLPAIKKLKKYLIELGETSAIRLESVKAHRHGVFAAGVAELYAIMKTLDIDYMDYSDGALREGVLYDMLGRQSHENVQNRSVTALATRYSVSDKQAKLVTDTALRLFNNNKKQLNLSDAEGVLLGYAARLHEIGLAISHSNYHQHTSYLLKHSDMFGFSKDEQDKLAHITFNHRRKLKADALSDIKATGGIGLVFLCLLLRLAYIAHHSRSRHSAAIKLHVSAKVWQVKIDEGNHRSLIIHQLLADTVQFAKWGVNLSVIEDEKQ